MKINKQFKKNILTLFMILFATFGLTTSLSCEGGTCDEVANYSDLVTSLLDITSGFISIGDDVIIANEITNEGISNVCDILSLTAQESKYSLDFDYRTDANSDWIESAATALITIEELIANSSAVENFNFEFQQGGQYRIKGLADAQNQVVERDENNNGNEFLQSRSSTNSQSEKGLLITVSGNVKGKSNIKVDENTTIIKLKNGGNSNLVSFKSITIKEAIDKN